jgi:hypothetical protein
MPAAIKRRAFLSTIRKDIALSRTESRCFWAKIDAHVGKALETKPTLVQISSAWNSREGDPLGRTQLMTPHRYEDNHPQFPPTVKMPEDSLQ